MTDEELRDELEVAMIKAWLKEQETNPSTIKLKKALDRQKNRKGKV